MSEDSISNAAAIARSVKQTFVRHPLRDNRPYPTMIVSRVGEPIAICDLEEAWRGRSNALRNTVAVLAPDEVVLVVESDPEATDAIEVFWMTSGGDGARVLLPYSCVGDTVVWEEPISAIELEGDIADSLREGFAGAGTFYEVEEARATLKSLGVRVRFAADPNPFVGVEPDDPCPCDSARKYKDCHGH
ncbi:MAG: SEC-C domain-containing protein [Acidimicrobiales bacterium]|nr:SEC-C domain-containing protein [Acidimicrobiales bacterium]